MAPSTKTRTQRRKTPSNPNPRPTSPTIKKKAYSEELVGKKIRIYWDLDEAWHEVYVKSFDSLSGKHLIFYEDDEEEEVVDLDTQKIELVQEELVEEEPISLKKFTGELDKGKNVVVDNGEEKEEEEEEEEVVKSRKRGPGRLKKKNGEEVVTRRRGRSKKNLSNGNGGGDREKRGSLSPVSKSIKNIVSLINNARGEEADISASRLIGDASQFRKHDAQKSNLISECNIKDANQNSSTSDSVPSSQSLQLNARGGNKPKTLVTIDCCGLLVGEHSSKFSYRAGELIRAHCPVNYADWRHIPKNFKDVVWNALMSEFEFNVPSQLVRSDVELSFPAKFRKHKHVIRKKYLKDGASQEDAESSCPIGYNPDTWKAFVARELQAKVKEANARNAENKKKNMVCHTLGRQSYANKKIILEKKGVVLEGRSDLWLKSHERADGSVHPSALEKYEKVKAAHEKRKNMTKEGASSQLDMDSDALTEVFGPDMKSHVRAYSSHISMKRARQTSLASLLIERRADARNPSLEAKVDMLASQLEEWSGLLKLLQIQGMAQATGGDDTSSFRIRSNSVQHTSQVKLNQLIAGGRRDNIDVESRVSANLYVNLLNRDGRVVATGYIVTGKKGEVCHGRKVLLGEKKVLIEEVHDVSAPVPDPPQGDGHFTLAGFVEGGSVIWLECRLQLIS